MPSAFLKLAIEVGEQLRPAGGETADIAQCQFAQAVAVQRGARAFAGHVGIFMAMVYASAALIMPQWGRNFTAPYAVEGQAGMQLSGALLLQRW